MSRTHGLGGTAGHRSWKAAKARCFNPNSSKYRDYGGRGIAMCEAWRDSYQAFLRDMGPRPSPKHSLDRIDVNGNYEPSNCRWATASEQACNRRKRRDTASGYLGVYRAKNRWRASVKVNGRKVHLGCAVTELGAAQARDAYITKHGLPHSLNFPVLADRVATAQPCALHGSVS